MGFSEFITKWFGAQTAETTTPIGGLEIPAPSTAQPSCAVDVVALGNFVCMKREKYE